jgi:hypothetical protein
VLLFKNLIKKPPHKEETMSRLLLLFSLAILTLAGCGGGGSAGTSSRANLFVSGGSPSGGTQTWITVYQVDLLTGGGSSVRVFSDPAGRTFNLAELESAAGGLFAFLGSSGVPATEFASVQVIVNKTVLEAASPQAQGVVRQIHSDFDHAANRSRLTLAFGAPKTVVEGQNDLVLDFDRSRWTEDAGALRPVLADLTTAGLANSNRHAEDRYRGIVSGLTGTIPNQTFTLLKSDGTSFEVETSASTKIYFSLGGTNPFLQNGRTIDVKGLINPATKRLLAREIEVRQPGDEAEGAKVKGPVTVPPTGTGPFTIRIERFRGFVPAASTIIVNTSHTNARFLTDAGVSITRDEFYAALPNAEGVEAEGVYDENTKTLLALKVKLEGALNEAEAKGSVSAFNATNRTLTITLSEWFGFAGTSGGALDITTTGSTEYQNEDHDTITPQQFFEALNQGKKIRVKGEFANGTITATRLRLD